MSMQGDEESLMQRFRRVFWQDFIHRFKPELLESKKGSSEECDIDRFKISTKSLIKDAETASVLLSKNEDLNDAATSSILFAVLPYMYGSLLYHHSQFELQTRAQVLGEVKTAWSIFLNYCKQLGITSEEHKRDVRDIRRDSLVKRRLLQPSFMSVYNAVDIDEVRDAVIDILEYFFLECSEELRFVEEEIGILKLRDDGSSKLAHIENEHPKKPWSLKLDKSNIRSILTNQVFRPDITLPSMSLDEFARLEMERMRVSASSTSTPDGPNENDEDFYRKLGKTEDEEEERAKDWDDWKDDNPRGSGNKLVNLG